MGFRYRKSIRLGGGFRINISGSGVGYSWGVPGYRITKTANGKIRQTASIPGTGLSYSTEESLHKSARRTTAKESPYIDTEVIQSVDRENYKDSDFKTLMKRIRRTRFLNKASFIIGSMDTKRNVFDTKIVPLLGNRKMNEITALDIRDWQQRVKEMGEATGLPYSETYLYTIHAQLTALFNYAQTFYGLRFNPCDAAGYMGSSVAGEMLIITKDQYELLRKEFRNEAYLLAFDILFWTGCREGEMLALLPKDLTDDDQLRIYKTYHRKKGQDIFGPTKNSKKGGNRNVPIPHWLAEEFRTYCSRLYGLTPDDRVFYMTCTALNKELTRCTQLTYLPDIRVHDLRHSHVSLCIELGYSIVLVARRIGDTVPVVMRTYAHLYPNKQQELVSKLEAIGSPSSNDDESDLMSLG